MKNNWDKYSESELNDLMKFADGYKEFNVQAISLIRRLKQGFKT